MANLLRLEIVPATITSHKCRYEDFLADTVVLRRRFTPDGERVRP